MRIKPQAGPVIPFRRRAEARPYFRMEGKADTADIYIYDVIGGDWFGEGTTAKSFRDELKALGDVKTLNIFVNSPGGDVFDGVAIFNQLARHKARKIVHIDGLAASIASVIAMAGDEIVIAGNGMIMIHRAWALALGNAGDMRKAADSLDKVDQTILGTYVTRTDGDEAEIMAMMEAETWMTADEAVEMGFADRKSEPVEMAALAKFDLSNFRRAPADLVKPAAAPPPAPDSGAPKRKPHQSLVRAAAYITQMQANRQAKA